MMNVICGIEFNRRSVAGIFSCRIPGVETPGYHRQPLCGKKKPVKYQR